MVNSGIERTASDRGADESVVAALPLHGWRPIDSAPRNGEPVDLWIVGSDDMVDFYAPMAKKVKGWPLRHGRAPDFRWEQHGPNPANWYPVGGLGYPLSPDVMATYWMPHPAGPEN